MVKNRLRKIISGYYIHGAEFFEWDYACEKDKLYVNEMQDLFQNGKIDEIGEKLVKWIKISKEEKKQIVKTLQAQKAGRRSDFEVNYKLLGGLFEKKKADDLSLGRWLMLKTYANIYGWYTFGLLCRNKAKERVYDHPKKPNYWRKRLLACIEDGKDEEAKQCFSYISSRPWMKGNRAIWEFVEEFYRMSARDNQSLMCEIEKLESRKREYYQYINEHDIWIIGPSPEKIGEQSLAKEGTAIVRFNYKGESWAKKVNINSRTDISYYRGAFCDNYLNENVDADEYINTQYMLLPVNREKVVDTVLVDKTIGYEHASGKITFEGGYNFLPIVIMDICKYGKKRIKVTGANLFLGELHIEGYTNCADRSEEFDSVRVFSIRCTPTANFSTLKLFYKWGIIEPLGELRQVLGMELKEYVEAMEQKYTLSVMQ